MTTVHLCGNAKQFVLQAVVFSKVWLNIYTYEFPRQTIYNALKGINQNAVIQAILSGNSKHSLLQSRLCVQQVTMVIYPGKKRDGFVIQETDFKGFHTQSTMQKNDMKFTFFRMQTLNVCKYLTYCIFVQHSSPKRKL